MKTHKFLLPVLALSMALTACDDQIMDWGTPKDHGAVTTADIPLAVKEVLANYESIKTYAQQYAPQMTVGLGLGANIFCDESDVRRSLAVNNFQMLTLGNAMKHDAVVGNSGAMNFSTLDQVIEVLPQDMQLWGHNFIWHTQQNQNYLKSLIKPTLVVESDSDIKSILQGDASNFDGGTTGGWGSWGSGKDAAEVVNGEGTDGSKALMLRNKGDGNAWEAQLAYTFDDYLDPTVEYTIRFKARCLSGKGELQFQYQNGTTYGSQGGYHTFDIGSQWTTCEYAFTPTADDVNRIILNFGHIGDTYYIDDIEFGIAEKDPMTNVLTGDDSDFEGGTTGGWGSWGSGKKSAGVDSSVGHGSANSLMLENVGDGNAWEAQCAYTFADPLENGKKYIIQFYAKSSSAAGHLQVQYQNSTTYGSQGGYTDFEVGTDWTLCEATITPAYDDVDRILINFGKVGGTYHIDDIKFGLAKNQSAAKRYRAAKTYYELKSAEEKREALLGAMDTWIQAMAQHLQEKGITPYGYDVINEPIADGSNAVRGVDNIFGMAGDEEPTESVKDGMSLNWESGHFYWGYYVKDYAVKAFQKARQYLPQETRLFVNDYNLDSSPEKLQALINFVNGIDQANGSPIVDGIGTQMHLAINPTDDVAKNNDLVSALKEKVDAQFRTLAQTGKLVRVTEFDVDMCSYNANGEREPVSSPSAAQYKAQADVYQMVFRSYLEIIPQEQQSGITIWGLTDKDDEHEFWLNGSQPNIYDAQGLRKWAYKGVCDGIAGEDLGLKFGGDDYKAYYERQNVSETVK